ncbi:MAG: TaqI-like C-terminal specificity domain-containing protein [Thermotaleaceae bacterium]
MPQVFDIVIGNPPYLGEKGNQEIFRKYRSTSFGGKYYEGKMDLFYYFIYRALEILKDGGLLSYITTNYFVTADGAQQLREYLKKHTTFLHVVNFNHTSLFSSARGQHNMIFLLAKGKETDEKMFLKLFQKKYLSPPSIEKGLYEREKHGHITHNHHLKNSNLFDRRGYILINGSNDEQLLLEKIDGGCDRRLRELCHINQGIVSGADRVTKNILNNKLSGENIKQYDILVNDGIFVLQKKEVLALGLQDSAYIKPMFKNSDIQSYQVKEDTEKFLLYIKDGQLDNIESEEEERIFKHLLKYKDILKLRREVKQGLRSWYALQWPRQQEIFEKPKIVVPHRAGENRFAYTNIPWYASADVYFITAKASHIDLRHLLIQLNSKLMYFWLYYRGKRKGSDLELYANPLKELPVCINHMEHKNILKMVNTIIKSKGQEMRAAIDAYVYRCYQLEPKEIKKIEELYSSNRR